MIRNQELIRKKWNSNSNSESFENVGLLDENDCSLIID